MRHLISLLILILSQVSYGYNDQIVDFKVDGEVIEELEQLTYLISEFNNLILDQDYEVELDLCVIYGSSNEEYHESTFVKFLSEAGFSLALEGIYGSFGNHVLEVLDSKDSSKYYGAVSGIYICE